MVRKILFFTLGDPTSASTWSNIPFLLAKTLEERGVELVRVNLLNARLDWIYNHTIRLFLRLLLLPFHTQGVYFPYTQWEKIYAEHLIRKVVRTHSDADYCIFINYLFYNKWNAIPSLLLSDWTQLLYRQRQGLKTERLQRRCDRQEREAVTHARHVVTIFESCASELRHLYPKAQIDFLGGNVINNFYTKKIEAQEVIAKKKKSHKLLIVAKPDRYKESTLLTIGAFLLLREKDPRYELHIVGSSQRDLGAVPDGVFCHGYLHKDKKEENEIFYGLLLNARVVINVTPKWAAYSSLIEAMYFYTPVLCSPFKQFVDEFGASIDFGSYNSEYSPQGVARDLEAIINSNRYDSLCMAAHNRVKDYTWEKYVDKLITLIEEK